MVAANNLTESEGREELFLKEMVETLIPDAETRETAPDAITGAYNSDNLGAPREQSRDFDYPHDWINDVIVLKPCLLRALLLSLS